MLKKSVKLKNLSQKIKKDTKEECVFKKTQGVNDVSEDNIGSCESENSDVEKETLADKCRRNHKRTPMSEGMPKDVIENHLSDISVGIVESELDSDVEDCKGDSNISDSLENKIRIRLKAEEAKKREKAGAFYNIQLRIDKKYEEMYKSLNIQLRRILRESFTETLAEMANRYGKKD